MNDAIMEVEIQYWKEMKDALDRLENNKDFTKLILEGYFKDFAASQTSMLASDYVRKTGTRPEVMERLIAISNLQDYFITIKNLVGNPEDYEADEDFESPVAE